MTKLLNNYPPFIFYQTLDKDYDKDYLIRERANRPETRVMGRNQKSLDTGQSLRRTVSQVGSQRKLKL